MLKAKKIISYILIMTVISILFVLPPTKANADENIAYDSTLNSRFKLNDSNSRIFSSYENGIRISVNPKNTETIDHYLVAFLNAETGKYKFIAIFDYEDYKIWYPEDYGVYYYIIEAVGINGTDYYSYDINKYNLDDKDLYYETLKHIDTISIVRDKDLSLAPDGNWYYYSNNKIDTSVNGMINSVHGWCYVKNGKWDKTVSGFIDTNIGWVYLKDGVLDTSFTGIVNNENGWWYVKEGRLDRTFTGMATNKYGTWYMSNGKLDRTVSGFVYTNIGWIYLKNGMLDTSFTGMANNKYGWWYIKNGKLDRTFTGIAYNKYGWWYIKNGKLDRTFTGIATNKYGKWYMSNGKLDRTFTGTIKYNGVTYKIKNGKVI